MHRIFIRLTHTHKLLPTFKKNFQLPISSMCLFTALNSTASAHPGLGRWFRARPVGSEPTQLGPQTLDLFQPWLLAKPRKAALPEVLRQLPWQLGQTIPPSGHSTTEGRSLVLSRLLCVYSPVVKERCPSRQRWDQISDSHTRRHQIRVAPVSDL